MSPAYKNKVRLPSIISVRHGVLMSIALAASACTGSAEPPLTSNPVALTAAQVYARDASSLIQSFQPIEFTDLSLLPGSGTVIYDGFLLGQLANLDDDLTDSFAGKLSLIVRFESDQMVTGIIQDVVDEDGNSLTGQLTLSGGNLNRSGNPNVDATFVFQGEGELTTNKQELILFDLEFEGDFLGSNNEGIGGDVLGRASTNNGSQAVGGLFILENDITP